MLAGEEVGDLFRDGKAYDVNVWSIPAARRNLTSIKMLPIDTPHHGHVTLGEVADVRIAPAQSVVYRENASRRIDVGGNVKNGTDLKGVMAEVKKKVDAIHFPLGYRAVIIGEYAERQAAANRLMSFAIAAALGVFLILLGSFGNLRVAILGFLTLPSALVGGLLGAYFTGGVISLGSMVGFLTVFGIAARNCILLINHYQHLEEQEGEPFGPGLVLRGAMERLSPILMTATATALALVPLVAAGAIPGHEIEHPMAIVILCGLVTSTMLNLFVVPFIYLHFGASRRRAEAPEPTSGDHESRGYARRSRGGAAASRVSEARAPEGGGVARDQQSRLQAVGEPELGEDVADVLLHRRLRDPEPRADLLVRVAVGDHRSDLELALRERALATGWTVGCGVREHPARGGRVVPRAALRHRADHAEQLAGSALRRSVAIAP
jgi:preprotein translocase subunit SecF